MKRVLITGSSGYIGRHLVKVLKNDYNVLGLDYKVCQGIPTRHEDINNLLEDITEFDTIVHLAALVNVNESVSKPYDYYNTNINGTYNVLSKLKYRNFIFASTGTASQPNCPYAYSKRVAEDIVEDYCKNHNKSFTTFRFYNVIGSDGFPPTNPDGLFFNLIKAEQTGIFNIFGNNYNTKDGTCVRDYVHVNEICHALKKAIDYPSYKLENLGHGIGWTVKEIVENYKRINNATFDIAYLDRRVGDLERTVLDNVSDYMTSLYTIDTLLKK
jgi:UDP-glucose 4-epimerase